MNCSQICESFKANVMWSMLKIAMLRIAKIVTMMKKLKGTAPKSSRQAQLGSTECIEYECTYVWRSGFVKGSEFGECREEPISVMEMCNIKIGYESSIEKSRNRLGNEFMNWNESGRIEDHDQHREGRC